MRVFGFLQEHADTLNFLFSNNVKNTTINAADEIPTPAPSKFFAYEGTSSANSWRVEPDIRTSEHETSSEYGQDSTEHLTPVFRVDGSSFTVPRQVMTGQAGDAVTFVVSKSSAFFLYGAVNYDHGGGKQAVITSSDSTNGVATNLDDGSDLLDFEQVIHWQSGLDRDKTYNVRISVGGQHPVLSFNRLVLIDGYVL